MSAELFDEARAWIADDPDSVTVAELEGVLAAAVQLDEVGFLFRAELALLAAQPALGARDGHAFACSGTSEIGFRTRRSWTVW